MNTDKTEGLKMGITTKDGLLYRDGQMLELPEANEVARAHGHHCAEQFVRALERKPKPLDSSNQFFVGVSGDRVVIQRNPVGYLRKEEAINLAAWLMLLADPDGKKFERVVKEISEA